MSEEITFAEALRLCGKHGVVEYEHGTDGLVWQEFYINQPYGPHVNMNLLTVANLAESKFRRVRPRKSRVQEMAERGAAPGFPKLREDVMTEAIRAVCDFARTLPDEGGGSYATEAIEREFLEPR